MNPSGETTCCDCPCQVASCFTFEGDGKRAQAKGLDRGRSRPSWLIDLDQRPKDTERMVKP
jgi:hypothetical protein